MNRPTVTALTRSLRCQMDALVTEFRADGIGERYEAKLIALKATKDYEEAQAAAKRIADNFLITMLAQWAKGDIEGPVTEDGLTRKINNAKSLAKMFVKKGDRPAAKRQLLRVKDLEAELEVFRAESKLGD